MLQKLKNFWENPYAAPVTEPLRNIGNTVRGFLAPYAEAFDEATNPRSYNKAKAPISRYMSSLFDTQNSFLTVITNFIAIAAGTLVAGGAGGAAAYGGLASAGAAAQWGGTAVAGLAAGAVGFVTAPVVMVAATAFVGVVVGTVLGGIPGVVKGAQLALKHHHDLKNPPPPAAAAPSPLAATKQSMTTILTEFQKLPHNDKTAMMIMLEERANAGATLHARVISNVEKMDATQRLALAEDLEERLADAFGVVATKKAAEAGILDEDVTVKPIATKLRRRSAAPAGAA